MRDSHDLPSHLVHVDTEAFNVERRKAGKGFSFRLVDGQRISDKKTRDFLASIPVPNTWTEVRLTLVPHSYILATGYDGSGKHQYLYHQDYLAFRNQQKFNELHDFGCALPRIRRRIKRDLNIEGWNEDKLLALMVKMLDKYHLRVGSRIYAKKNQTFGLTTLRKKHLKEDESDLHFEYVGKAGKKREVHLTDPDLVALIREVADFPGQELFSFRQQGELLRADADSLNDYIRRAAGADFTARTFRTWAGTVLAVKYLNKARAIIARKPRRELGTVLTELVAEQLGNTTAICRTYYIHPQVFEQVISEDFDPTPCDKRFLRQSQYRRHECRTLEILSSFPQGDSKG